jgi:preprotein translocase subunit SecG
MLTNLILVVHIIVCVALILIILLQTGKGADIGAVFGGGSSQTLFGSTGATPFLSKVTIGAAVVFMVTSIILTYFAGRMLVTERSIVSDKSSVEAPITGTHPSEAPPVPPAAAGGPSTTEKVPAAAGAPAPAATSEPAPAPKAPPAAETAAPSAPAAPVTPPSAPSEQPAGK